MDNPRLVRNRGSVRGKKHFVSGLILLLGISVFGLLPHAQQTRATPQASQALLQSKDTTHGERQVQQMLIDRPMMAVYTTRDGKQLPLSSKERIWQWAANVYGSTINGARIVWDKSDISDKPLTYVAEHDIPSPSSQGAIRLRTHILEGDGTLRQLEFEELWNSCVFELINIQKAQRFLTAYTRAFKGEINRTEFVRFCKETEYQSLTEVKRFYVEVWKPWAEWQNVPTTEDLWEQELPPTYDAWIALYDGTTAYKYWEDYYDRVVLPALDTQRK